MQPGENAELLPLLRFTSTCSEGQPVALRLRGPDDRGAEGHLLPAGRRPRVRCGQPASRTRSRAPWLEVLLLTDPFDGYVMQGVREFEGKTLRNVDDPGLELPGEPKAEEVGEEKVEDTPQADFAEVLACVKLVLGDRVTEVRESKLLTDSPACLVSPNVGYHRDLQRVRRLIEEDFKLPPKMLELNRRHALVQHLAREGQERANVSAGGRRHRAAV